MSDGLVIVALAGLALFLVFKLKDLLGRPVGREKLDQSLDPGEQESDTPTKAPPREKRRDEDEPLHEDSQISGQLEKFRAVDSSFHPDEFVEGAKAAFEMVMEAYAEGDEATLKSLLAPDVFKDFKAAIDDFNRRGEKLKISLVGILSSRISDAELEGDMAYLTVDFKTQQITATHLKADDSIVDGDEKRVVEVHDRWVFARNLASSDPNWTLVSTQSPD